VALVIASGCAQQAEKVWFKSGATQEIFAQDRYRCIQEARTPYSNTYVNPYAGASVSDVRTDWTVFNACMEAKGWRLVDKPTK
jgi:hypothetical protein